MGGALSSVAGAILPLESIYNYVMKTTIHMMELDLLPDFITRRGIRYLLAGRERECNAGSLEQRLARKLAFVEELKTMPIAIETKTANEQHYEVPTEYFLLCLGKHLKYSSCYYNSPSDTLNQAEENMLKMTCARAELAEGQEVLELGCGWGSLSLFMARAFPGSRFTSVSNSRTQKEFIMSQAKRLGLTNLQVITANMVDFKPPAHYDRVVSVEMFEHMKNYQELLGRVASWLKPGGKLFVHIFVHKEMPYHYEDKGEDDWMTRYFFSGGTMPSLDLLMYFPQELAIQKHWYVNGVHYSRTLEAWLQNQDNARAEIMPIFEKAYGGKAEALKWFVRWRVFYLACSELFRWKGGDTWGVGHYLFEKKAL